MAAEHTGAAIESAASRTPSRAGRNLPAAIAVGVGLGVVIICSLAFYKALFLVVVAAAIGVALWELANALSHRGTGTPLPLMLLGSTGMLAGAFYGGPRVLLVVFASAVLATTLWRMRRGQEGFVQDVTATVFCLAYAPFLASFVALLLDADDGVQRVVTFIVVVVASDTGGYAVGAALGRHLLAPAISPKKSWEGFAGSAAGCALAGVLCMVFLLDDAWWVGLVLGALVVVAATLGDLAESLIKRDLGVKDMSNILPGHGGIMDRLDSLLASVPVVWLVLTFLLPHV
ncbi:MAG: phosphatidate cytidylyltransferase [Nocardioidaceae bacterium]